MGFSCGIVGLPNVGKSTVFNALTRTQAAQAGNYPFCTIEPNRGKVAVPDSRLDALSVQFSPVRTLATQLEFVDIAGLVRGASRGDGLGNKFLGHIREMDALCHVVRCFGGDVTHVEGSCDPLRDIEIIETELLLADMEHLARRLASKKLRVAHDGAEQRRWMETVHRGLDEGRWAQVTMEAWDEPAQAAVRAWGLMTSLPMLYVCNVGEEGDGGTDGGAFVSAVEGLGRPVVVISAQVEAELAGLEDEGERRAFLEALGLERSGLDAMVQAGYGLLDLVTFFTAGPQEVRAWTVPRGTQAAQAAGVIHTDFERGFIAAEVISCADLLELGGEQAAREAGRMRLEGRDYVVCDGDVMHVRFNV